jgi:methylthioribose-1-phosphate isomerase
MPVSTLDVSLADGSRIPIEERSAREVTHIAGICDDTLVREVRVAPEATAVANPGFDVTPGRLVSGLITERGIVPAQAGALCELGAGT